MDYVALDGQQYRVGSRVKLRTHDNTYLFAEVKSIHETTAGVKVQVSSGATTMRIDAEQIFEVVRF